jgi:hypothetical protein
MGAGAIFLLFILLFVVVIGGGALYAIRAGLWVRETSPKAEQPDGAERPEHVAVEDEADARFDAPERETAGRQREPR